ncbi:MAG: putative ABC transport system ATP-binding protein [Flammeovirgaceae bacterium]|jgi:ABC-type lipoprotein export system ATPase subunit
MNILQTQSLKFSYDSVNSFSFPDIQLQKGEHLLILGKSGVGKTTFLHLLAGLLKAKKGEIIINNQDICQISSKKLDQFRGKHIGLVFQHSHFVNAISLLNNLLLIQKIGKLKPDKQRCLDALEKIGLADKIHQRPHSLSQGERQRAGIVLATINQPQVILADEPTASLDDENCHKVMELLLKQASQTQASLIVITHDSRLKPYFNQVLNLSALGNDK